MLDPEILDTTASEPLSLDEENAMQASWREDGDKITFIACLPLLSPEASLRVQADDSPDRMVGDINLFLTPAEEDEEGCIGEIELMIAETKFRRRGLGRAAVLAFMRYLESHLDEILSEYASSFQHGDQNEGQDQSPERRNMKLLQLRVKIGSKNLKSIGLFESLGFVKTGEGENYFGEVELVFEGWLGKGRLEGLMGKFGVKGYREVGYAKEE